jgi:ABC-type nitrate/sulfonate/bicarbonate transport system substrate-binding protein
MKLLHTTALAAAMVGTLAFGAPARAADMEHTSIALPALTVTFLPVYIAKDEGMWDKLGLDVTLHDITGMGATNAMLAGSVDFTVQSGPSLIRGNIRGRHMLGIALMADGVAFEVLARKESFPGFDPSAPLVKRVAMLKGKKVNVDSPNTVVDALLRYFSAKAGLNTKSDMTETYMQPTEAIAALKSGSIDASVLNFPWAETAKRQGAMLLASGLSDVPELLPTIATTTTTRGGFCDDHASICSKMVHGYIESHKFIHEHPDQALQIAMKRMPKANAEDIKKSLQELAKTTPLVPRYDEAAFAHAQEIMVAGGMLHKDEMLKNFSGMFTNKYVDMFAKKTM